MLLFPEQYAAYMARTGMLSPVYFGGVEAVIRSGGNHFTS